MDAREREVEGGESHRGLDRACVPRCGARRVVLLAALASLEDLWWLRTPRRHQGRSNRFTSLIQLCLCGIYFPLLLQPRAERSIQGGAQQDRIIGGSQLTSIRIAERLGSRVVLNAPVTKVRATDLCDVGLALLMKVAV